MAAWIIDGESIVVDELTLTPQTLTLSATVARDQVDLWRQYSRAGDLQRRQQFGGDWRVIADDKSTVTIEPPSAFQPVLQSSSEWYAQGYEESQAAPDRVTLSLTFVRPSKRTEANTAVTQSGDPWEVDLDRGTLSLTDDQVEQAQETGTTTGGEWSLPLRLTDDQATTLVETCRVPAAVVDRPVPDGTDVVEDTADGRQTLTISGPPNTILPDGDYAIRQWSLSQAGFGTYRWRVDTTLAELDIGTSTADLSRAQMLAHEGHPAAVIERQTSVSAARARMFAEVGALGDTNP